MTTDVARGAEPRAEVERLVQAVQTNCDIADARHAADLSLCNYLLQMREFHRWEVGAELTQALDRNAVGAWLKQRESDWAALESEVFVALPIQGRELDPLDNEGINAHLLPQGLVYGAGLAGADRPGFFLAHLEASTLRDSVRLLVSGRECARGLFAPPAALIGDTVLLRRDALRRWLWQKFETWGLRHAPGAFQATLDAHGFDGDPAATLERMVDAQSETLVLHELGEWQARRRLGPAWGEMRLALASRRAEVQVGALKDQLADCLVTLPTLLERDARAAIHFWFSNFEGLRSLLFPALQAAYGPWRDGDGGRALRVAVERARTHALDLCRQVLDLHAEFGALAGARVERLLASPEAVCTAG